MKHFKLPRIVALLSFIMLGCLCIAAEPTYEPIVVEGEGYRLQINIQDVDYHPWYTVESEEFGNYNFTRASFLFNAAYEGFHYYASLRFNELQPDGSWKYARRFLALSLTDGKQTGRLAIRDLSVRGLLEVTLKYVDEDGQVQRHEHRDVLNLLDYVKPEDRDLFLYEWERQTTALDQIEMAASNEAEYSEVSEYQVYNSQGALVRTASNAVEIRSGVAPGIYIVAIRQANGIVSTEKMIVR